MTRKGIAIRKIAYEQLKDCKIKETERTANVIVRLLDKYEKELLK